MKKLITLILLLSTSIVSADFYFFVVNKNKKLLRPKQSLSAQGHGKTQGGYQIRVTKAQFEAGYDALDPALVSSIIQSIDQKSEASKPEGLKAAENAMIEFLRGEGYIQPTDTKVPPDIYNTVVSDLLSKVNSTPPTQDVEVALSKFNFCLLAVERAGGSLEKVKYHQ
jgi:hypothetical protein